MRLAACLLCLAPALAAPLAGQTPATAQTPASVAGRAPHNVIAVNPLGFLQFGPTVEADLALGSGAALALGVRLPGLGLLSHAVDMDLQSGWMLIAAPRLMLDRARAPAGWFVGPRLEWGRTGSSGTTSTVLGGGLEAGHRWVFSNGVTLTLGGIAGGFRSNWVARDDASNTGSLKAGFVMGVLSVGRAF